MCLCVFVNVCVCVCLCVVPIALRGSTRDEDWVCFFALNKSGGNVVVVVLDCYTGGSCLATRCLSSDRLGSEEESWREEGSAGRRGSDTKTEEGEKRKKGGGMKCRTG